MSNPDRKITLFVAPGDEDLKTMSPEIRDFYQGLEEQQKAFNKQQDFERAQKKAAEEKARLEKEERLAKLQEKISKIKESNAENLLEEKQKLEEAKEQVENDLQALKRKEEEKGKNDQELEELLKEEEEIAAFLDEQKKSKDAKKFLDQEDELSEDFFQTSKAEEEAQKKAAEAYKKQEEERKEKLRQQTSLNEQQIKEQNLLNFYKNYTLNNNLDRLDSIFYDPDFISELRSDKDNNQYVYFQNKNTGTELFNTGTRLTIQYHQQYNEKGRPLPMSYEDAASFIQVLKTNNWKSIKTFGNRRDRKMVQMAAMLEGIKVDNKLNLTKDEQQFFEYLKEKHAAHKKQHNNNNEQQTSENDKNPQESTVEENTISEKIKNKEDLVENSKNIAEPTGEQSKQPDINAVYSTVMDRIADFNNKIHERINLLYSDLSKANEEEWKQKIQDNNMLDEISEEKVYQAQLNILQQKKEDLIKYSDAPRSKRKQARQYKKHLEKSYSKESMGKYLELLITATEDLEGNGKPLPPLDKNDKNTIITAALYGHSNGHLSHLIANEKNDQTQALYNIIMEHNKDMLYSDESEDTQDSIRDSIYLASRGQFKPLSKELYNNFVNLQKSETGFLQKDASTHIQLAKSVTQYAVEENKPDVLKEVSDFIKNYEENSLRTADGSVDPNWYKNIENIPEIDKFFKKYGEPLPDTDNNPKNKM